LKRFKNFLMKKLGEYIGGQGVGPFERAAEKPKELFGVASVELEGFDAKQWEQVQKLHKTREDVYATLETGIQDERSAVDGANADPKYWKIMGDSLKTLGIPPAYVDQHLGRMESIMAAADENGPGALAEHKAYIDNAVDALNQCLVAVRDNEKQFKASGNPLSSPWKNMASRWNGEKEKMAVERVRRGARVETPKESSDAVDLDSLDSTQRDPKYWNNVADLLAIEGFVSRVTIGALRTLSRRLERRDLPSDLDMQMSTILDNIQSARGQDVREAA
jgi:hypothetical protein